MGFRPELREALREARRPAGKPRRSPPSQAEQERRKAWGDTYGPLVGKSIRDYIAAAEG